LFLHFIGSTLICVILSSNPFPLSTILEQILKMIPEESLCVPRLSGLRYSDLLSK
jgi:hypothetical protein